MLIKQLHLIEFKQDLLSFSNQ